MGHTSTEGWTARAARKFWIVRIQSQLHIWPFLVQKRLKTVVECLFFNLRQDLDEPPGATQFAGVSQWVCWFAEPSPILQVDLIRWAIIEIFIDGKMFLEHRGTLAPQAQDS